MHLGGAWQAGLGRKSYFCIPKMSNGDEEELKEIYKIALKL